MAVCMAVCFTNSAVLHDFFEIGVIVITIDKISIKMLGAVVVNDHMNITCSELHHYFSLQYYCPLVLGTKILVSIVLLPCHPYIPFSFHEMTCSPSLGIQASLYNFNKV